MRDSNERTNIVLPKWMKKELKRRKGKAHGSMSQLTRMAILDFFDEELLFSIDTNGIAESLERGVIPEELMDKFEEEGYGLSTPTLTEREVGWKIRNGEETYPVRAEADGKLNIYIKDDDGVGEVDLRPIVEQMEKANDRIGEIEGRLQNIEKVVDFLDDKFGGKKEKIADDIQEVLEERGEALSTADISYILPYSESEIMRGIERLKEEFMMKRIESEKGLPKWEIGGRKSRRRR